MIRIHCTKPGFRRAGQAHPAVADYPEDHFSAAQMAALRAEPLLVVEMATEDTPKPPIQTEAPALEAPEATAPEAAAAHTEKTPKKQGK